MKFAEFLEQQTHEDRQAFIIHYPALSGKTQFIQKACQVIPAIHYVDLLEYSLAKPEVSALGRVDPGRFRDMLLDIDKSVPENIKSIVIDQGDFILNTWDSEEKQEFLHLIRQSLRTPSVVKKTFIFVIQTDGAISSAVMTNSRNQSRILALNEFEAL